MEGYGIHVDGENDPLPGLGWVAVFNRILVIGKKTYRLSVIGYSRASIGAYHRRENKYKEIIDRINEWAEGQAGRKDAGPQLLHPETDILSEDKPLLDPARFNKFPFYSTYESILDKVLTKLNIEDRWGNFDDEVVNALLGVAITAPILGPSLYR